VKDLFNLRLQYKNDDNPTQEIIRILLNSINVKIILKPIETYLKLINKEDSDRDNYRNYKSIEKYEEVFGSKFVKIDEIQPIDKHYNLVHYGATILSMSKIIMNEVICLAENNGIRLYYQDTDSQHIKADDVIKLSELYKNKIRKRINWKEIVSISL
jgi:hypothetical protein